ncbi:MAG TPA: STAS domain-containing protein [Terriglobales bacterium]|nr:STAS domain-containing protein [Terriglobales bacterium]
MFHLQIERIGDVAIIQCEGRMMQSESVFELRDAVMTQNGVSTVLLDLSELEAIGGGGAGMLVMLQSWTHSHGMEFKLFDPQAAVKQKLQSIRSAAELKIASMDEVLRLLGWDGPRSDMHKFESVAPRHSAA